jgi:hypothetical protein
MEETLAFDVCVRVCVCFYINYILCCLLLLPAA